MKISGSLAYMSVANMHGRTTRFRSKFYAFNHAVPGKSTDAFPARRVDSVVLQASKGRLQRSGYLASHRLVAGDLVSLAAAFTASKAEKA